ncbi:beta-phosphoglucomutase [Halalkalibacter sp. AB-rgal2]|uniref:beta-phosphoglucomutase n=1 Tax=Halalkalibacter sp. AB-rgal2 TaxID=3242695 RepID=UPI00359E9A8D
MKKIKAVIFDMDGVISNTIPLHYIVNKRVADQLGIEYSHEWNMSMQGLSRTDTVKEIVAASGKNVTQEEFEELCDQKNKHYRNLLGGITESDAQPGIRPFIEQLSELGLPLVVASASRNAPFVLTQLKLKGYFKDIVDVTTLKRGKPDPEIFLKAADLAGVKSGECVAIEDGAPGLKAILQTDMYAVGVGDYDYLKEADAHFRSTEAMTVSALEKHLNQKGWTLYE